MINACQKQERIACFSRTASRRDYWKRRNRLYHRTLEDYFAFTIPEGASVLEVGCGTGDLLGAVKPSRGVGVDFSPEMIAIAKAKHPDLTFICADAEDFSIEGHFDYLILSDLLCSLLDIQKVLRNLRRVCSLRTRVVISNYNHIWQPILEFGEKAGLTEKRPPQNWLSFADIENLLRVEGFELVKLERKLLLPVCIPGLHTVANRFLANLPGLNHLGLCFFMIARTNQESEREYSVSILMPARNEQGNIENAILRTPSFGRSQEFVFVEGHSQDGTWEEIQRVKEKYKDRKIIALKQTGKGKGNAVREGFAAATGEVLMILDADLTTPPEDLPKFYEALARNRGDFINGCRLVYPMEKQAMRFLNLLGNKFFSLLFSFLLGQRVKDTLCGTKVLFKQDYDKIVQNRRYFGDFDPFGDFDLLFGASKLNMKIVEIFVRYRDREYGTTQISRIRHGWMLLQMSFFAALKIKFR